MMKCPICHSNISDDAVSCNTCETKGLNRIFLSQSSRLQWISYQRERWEQSIIGHGLCGTEIYWLLKKDGHLLISGSGKIEDMEMGTKTVNDWDDYYHVFYRDYYPKQEYVNGKWVYTGVPNSRDYQHEEMIDTVPWRNYRDKITHVVISEGIIGIGNNAFVDCCNLSSVQIPDTIETIGDTAFKNCDNLTIKQLPSHLTYLGNNAFVHSDGYSGCMINSIPPTIKYIGDNAFYVKDGNKELRTVAFSDLLTYIGENAFRGCANMCLYSKFLPGPLRSIGRNAFGGCWNLREIVLPDGIVSISDFAFADCRNLTEIRFSNTLQRIGESSFSECKKIEKIELPSSIEDICDRAFENCDNLRKVVFEGGFPQKNAKINYYMKYSNGDVCFHHSSIGQADSYNPFAGVGCIDIYYKPDKSEDEFYKLITQYNWGAKKVYWHQVY